jgi:DNA-binding transcriptional LysR family regulator
LKGNAVHWTEAAMKLQQLTYFITACQLGSISLAAEALHVSQPSISMAIRELEREFGVTLTVRC